MGKTNPVTSGFGDIFSDLFWGETERTNLWGKSGGSTDFTTGCAKVAARASQSLPLAQIGPLDGRFLYLHDLHLIWIEFWG